MKKRYAVVVLTLTLLLCLTSVIPAAGASSAQRSGAFTGCFSIDTAEDGPSLTLHLVFSRNHQTFAGHAFYAPNDTIIIEEQAYGSYFTFLILGAPYMTILGKGYPEIAWPPNGGIGPVILPTLEFGLSTYSPERGQPAKGQFRVRDDSGEWGPWVEGNVESFPCATP